MSSMLVYPHTPLDSVSYLGYVGSWHTGSKLKGCWCFEVLEYVITCVMSLARTANVIGDACQSKKTTAVAMSKPVWLCVLRPVMGVALLIGKLSLVFVFCTLCLLAGICCVGPFF